MDEIQKVDPEVLGREMRLKKAEQWVESNNLTIKKKLRENYLILFSFSTLQYEHYPQDSGYW